MPTFQCKKCGRQIRAQPDIHCPGNVMLDTEKPFETSPYCCGQPMIETIED